MAKSKKIKLDPHNARIHDDTNQTAIKNSLKELGAGRSIVMDSQNVIIGGNGVFEQAQELGLPVKIIESDGKELIAIKRTDLKTNSDKRKALAIVDNKASDLSFFDDDKLAKLFNGMEDFVENSGFTDNEINSLIMKMESDEPGVETPEEKPEVEFSEELLESHNYIVLYFNNDIDWLQAKTLFNLKTVKDSSAKKNYPCRGIGKVIDGAKAINLLTSQEQGK